ncbi:MAG: PAS domain-containing sensor histidine kinase, partial [Paracoccaceae bacterium]|nr:PAS domain-containing sensor histidine kinase [Paracoccaceae bacterium]
MMQENALWASLPMPAVLLDENDLISELNPAAEGFFNMSCRAVIGGPIWDRLAVDAPIESSLKRARAQGSPLFVNDVDVGSGNRPPLQCNLSVAPLAGHSGTMILLIYPRELAHRITQSHSVKSAAKSAIGMAEML